MSSQPTPKVTREDVERVASRDFSSDSSRALEILREYGQEEWHKEPERVRLAALKLARGDIDQLRAAIETAKQDYRDVIAWAEYPAYMSDVSPSAKIPGDDRKKVIDADWQQYIDWLTPSDSDD